MTADQLIIDLLVRSSLILSGIWLAVLALRNSTASTKAWV